MGDVAQLSQARRRRGSLARMHIYGAILEAIVRAELEPGRRLSENELAEWLGVSRTPVREAIARLRDDGLVEIVGQLGTFVAPISPTAVADAQFIREALECAAIRVAATRVADSDLELLETSLQGQERARDTGDHDAFYALDEEFHHTLCDLSGHVAVWAISQRAKAHLNRIRRLSLPAPNYLPEMISEHDQVVAALARRDPDAAESTLRHHLRMVLSELPSLRDAHPEYFDDQPAPQP